MGRLGRLHGQGAGAQITIIDGARHARFHVHGWTLMGIEVSEGLTQEDDALLDEMVGTPIDPCVLREALTVDDALSAIAVNAGNVVCAQLEACRAMRAPPSHQELAAAAADDPPPTLETLPSAVLEQVLCACGSLRAVSSLAVASRALAAVAGGSGGGALPVDEEPAHWDPAEVEWEARTRTLTRTARAGYGQVVFAQRLCRSALLELEVLACPPAGLVVGVLQEAPGALAMKRVEYNCHGVVARVGRQSSEHSHYGWRLRPGDVLGCAFDAATRQACWTMDGRAMGPPVELLDGRSRQLAFFVRFECNGSEADGGTAGRVRLVPAAARRAPLDLCALHAARALAPRTSPRAAGPCKDAGVRAGGGAGARSGEEARGGELLVREVGPSGRGWYVDLRETAGLEEVRAAVAPLVQFEPRFVQLMRGSGRPLTSLAELEWREGRPLHAVYVNIPHLVS